MPQAWMTPWLLMAIPVLGAIVCLLVWSSLHWLKTCALMTTGTSLLVVIGLPWTLNEPPAAFPFLLLLPAAAFLSLLGQPRHPRHRLAWITTLVLLGLGLAVLTSQDPARSLLLVMVLGLLCALLARSLDEAIQETWKGLASFGLGIVSGLLTLVIPAPAADVAGLVSCATLLPLLPVHGGFVAAVTRLPGNLPAFLVVLLPVLGYDSLLRLLPTLTPTMFNTLAILALAGACYGSLRAWIQSRPSSRLAYAGLAFLCVLWWYIADTGTAPVQATVYLSAVGLATSGLLLAWYAIRARFGDVDVRALGGMAYPMPRFSTILALLALAALGMPPFGVFAGLVGMLLSPDFTPSAPFFLIMIVWLSASWYFLELVQWLVFGQPRLDLRFEDLRHTEFASLLIVLALLLALGTAPSRLFQLHSMALPASVALTEGTWIR